MSRSPFHDTPSIKHHGFVYDPSASTHTRSKQSPRIETAVSMTVTPASAIPSSSPSTNSPSSNLPTIVSPSGTAPMSEMPVDQPATWQGPTPPVFSPPTTASGTASPNTSFSAMQEALGKSRTPGLIRRLSRGAHNRLRRRASTTQTNRIRDQSAGPVLARRRSDSTGTSDLNGEMSDLELEHPSEDGVDDNASSIISMEPANALGISTPRRSTGSAFEGGIAPTISSVLEQGTWLIKVTKKKRKTLKFRLDTSTAKVCWDSSNPAKQFYIDDVREIRVGAESRNSRQDIQVPADQESCWMTIVYDVVERSKGRTIKTMHLIAPNDFIVKLWKDALKSVERERIESMNALSSNPDKSERSRQMAWKAAMARKRPEHEPKIDFEDARWICRKLEINCSPDTARSYFNESDRDLVGMLNYSQYEHFVSLFKVRKDIQAVYNAAKPPEELEMSRESFYDFLTREQGLDVEKDALHWMNRFDSLARIQSSRSLDAQSAIASPSMSLQAFQNFLTSSANSCLTSDDTDTALDRPLNEYFISSSHNTYLLGRQVAGASSVEGYISALVKGCRCIEIDCWDGKNGRPVVNHGRTLSTEVLFEDCISVINKYAFASSAYPLIVSLEVHCNPEQQATMVDIMVKYFGESLLIVPIWTNAFTLPSPEELRNRVLIRSNHTNSLMKHKLPIRREGVVPEAIVRHSLVACRSKTATCLFRHHRYTACWRTRRSRPPIPGRHHVDHPRRRAPLWHRAVAQVARVTLQRHHWTARKSDIRAISSLHSVSSAFTPVVLSTPNSARSKPNHTITSTLSPKTPSTIYAEMLTQNNSSRSTICAISCVYILLRDVSTHPTSTLYNRGVVACRWLL